MLIGLLKKLYRKLFPVRIRGKENIIDINSKYSGFTIDIYGDSNIVRINQTCVLKNTHIYIYGNGAEVIISSRTRFLGPCVIYIYDGGSLYVGENVGIRGVSMEIGGGESITIGDNSMFSYGITLRNHDSHKVIDYNSGRVINPAKPIKIGKHVWVCKNVTILKGVEVGNDSVLGYGALVTNNVPANTIAAGVPAVIVKESITWDY